MERHAKTAREFPGPSCKRTGLESASQYKVRAHVGTRVFLLAVTVRTGPLASERIREAIAAWCVKVFQRAYVVDLLDYEPVGGGTFDRTIVSMVRRESF